MGTTALLIVDVQRALVTPPHGVPGGMGLVSRLTSLVERARDAGACVIHVQDEGASAGSENARGTPGWELVLPVLDGEPVVHKVGDNAFAGTDLLGRLQDRDVDTVDVVGIQSEMCVSATAHGAQSHGFTVVLPRGGHATYDIPGDRPDVPVVPAALVARVVEWSLGDQVLLPHVDDVAWRRL